MLKILQLKLTVIQIILMCKQFLLIYAINSEHENLDERLMEQESSQPVGVSPLRRLRPASIYKMVAKSSFEIFVCGIFAPPFYHKKVAMSIVGKMAIYNVESLLALCVLVRSYHFWRLWKYWMFQTYLGRDSALVGEEVRQLINKFVVSPSLLMVKISLHRQFLLTISVPSLLAMFAASYAIRIFEGPSSARHSVYYWDQMWLVTETFFAAPFGEYFPVTQLGRCVGTFCMIFGSILVSVITASFGRSVAISPQEQKILFVLEEDALRHKVLESATRIIQFWWRAKLADEMRFASRDWRRLFKKLFLAVEEHVAFRRQAQAFMDAQEGQDWAARQQQELLNQMEEDGDTIERLHKRVRELSEQHALGTAALARAVHGLA
eukprot:CAMPEP_0113688144 /NCGR_PEP_ID=MMETSP0038_2-20120614/16352_1 /TAXON_ID=2898 /ORGANISM="Cryptomonas paramecium" /LENGTH=378 /DNA_ID=CAMNT_0000608885 /DNA_START=314 /DNA_END=1446 /DNA_ORIENTATION=- /assembly_acc=CAM_ASM_000170